MNKRFLFSVLTLITVLLAVARVGRAAAPPVPASTRPAVPAEALKLVENYPLLKAALTDDTFFSRYDKDVAFQEKLRVDLGNAAYRKFGDTRSVRVEMWRGTSTEMPMLLLEYQTSFAKFGQMPAEGPVILSPVYVGTGRDAMWHRTMWGGTDDVQAHEEFEGLLKQCAALPSNRRTTLDPQFAELAKKYLPGTPLDQVYANVKSEIGKLVEACKPLGAQVLTDPQYGPYGVKLTDHLYLYLREFPNGASRAPVDPFFWFIISGGPKPWLNDYIPSFPGAEGMGARTTGGRGGKVIYVTTLKPTGPGSLGEAINTKGPRTVLFKVSGQITLPGAAQDTMKPGENDQVWINQPDLTLIGYTAPGEGVEIKGRLCIAADNVIIRGMRYRMRPDFIKDGMSTDGNLKNIIFDHCSFAYASDEQLRLIGYGSELWGFTIQYCLLGPSLGGTGDHPYGPEVGGFGSIHHNIFYNTLSRSPEVDCDLIDWSYNVMANLRRGHSDRPRSRVNMVDNYFIDIPGNFGGGGYSFDVTDAVWQQGNVREAGTSITPLAGRSAYLKHAYNVVPLTADKPEELEAKLTPLAGAFLPVRDSTDKYFLQQLKDRKSKLPIYKAPGKVWTPYGNENANAQLYEDWDPEKFPPPAAGAVPLVDTDGDGMPDAWETANGFNPNDPSDGPKDADGDGYTNLEEYLNHTDPRAFVDYKNPANNKHSLHDLKPPAPAGG